MDKATADRRDDDCEPVSPCGLECAFSAISAADHAALAKALSPMGGLPLLPPSVADGPRIWESLPETMLSDEFARHHPLTSAIARLALGDHDPEKKALVADEVFLRGCVPWNGLLSLLSSNIPGFDKESAHRTFHRSGIW